MWVSNPTSGLIRCWRSPSPVSVGVKTSCPNALSKGDTRFQHQPPCQAPWTSTKFRERSEGGIDIGVLLVIRFEWATLEHSHSTMKEAITGRRSRDWGGTTRPGARIPQQVRDW